MKVGARPSDEQIIHAMNRWRKNNPTYVIKNILADTQYGGFDDLNTSHVLYRLKKLEKTGLVKKIPSVYYPFFEWVAVDTDRK